MSNPTVWQSKAEEKARIMAQCAQQGVTVTQLRTQVLDIVLNMSGV
ncbi:ParG, partial [Snodgrassella alvi SCGC AB-598-J21]